MTWAATGSAALTLAPAVLSYAGAQGSATAQGRTARAENELAQEKFKEEKRKQQARENAYKEMLGRAGGEFKSGEESFMKEATTALPELQSMEQQIAGGGAQTMQDVAKQTQLNLAQQGVRGGQAATALKRATGDVAKGTLEDINKMKFQEAGNRAQARQAYLSSKAARGQTAGYTPATF